MSQFKGATMRAQNGSPTVRFVWKPFGALGGTGTFSVGEALSWSGGGAGVYVFDNGSQLELYRTAGPNPAVGTVLSGTTRTFTIASFPAENLTLTAPVCASPPAFSTTGGSQGPIAANHRFAFVGGGQPVGIVSATIGSDSFDLTASWSGATLIGEVVIHRDSTVNQGWPLVGPRNRAPFVLIEEFQHQLDAWTLTAGGGGGGTPPTSFTTFTMTNNWANVAGRAAAAHAYHANSDSVELKGYISRTSGSATSGEDIVAAGGLPSGRRPAERLDFSYEGERFSVRTDGSIKYDGVSGAPPGPISLNGIRFRADGS